MMTLRQFAEQAPAIPAATSWYLADVTQALGKQGKTDSFRIADLQRECPGVSVDMIRHVLKKLREKGAVECLGRGRNAIWKRLYK
jgi:predicted transcriptional regulator of viral defense system